VRDIAYGQSLSAELCRSVLSTDGETSRLTDSGLAGIGCRCPGAPVAGLRNSRLPSVGGSLQPGFLEPEIAFRFGRADLVAGRCLVDIKTALDPSRYFEQWLNQVLGYALLDWADILCLEAGPSTWDGRRCCSASRSPRFSRRPPRAPRRPLKVSARTSDPRYRRTSMSSLTLACAFVTRYHPVSSTGAHAMDGRYGTMALAEGEG